MANYRNFYETIQEAQSRIQRTVVLYDGQPVYIWTVQNHKGDGAFRVYISPIELVQNMPSGFPAPAYPPNHPSLGEILDTWMTQNPDQTCIQRKKMDSPLFNKFRPFPLGMVNSGGSAYYIERAPQRPKMEQGLIPSALYETLVTAGSSGKTSFQHVSLYSETFRDCILGKYPTPNEVLIKIKSGNFINESVAFNRYFALVKGPIDMLFLAYKGDVIGVLPYSNFDNLKLGKEFLYLKEAVNDLALFNVLM